MGFKRGDLRMIDMTKIGIVGLCVGLALAFVGTAATFGIAAASMVVGGAGAFLFWLCI